MEGSTENDAAKFGLLVRQKREARRWSQEALAAAAFSNATRKGYISLIENGKVPNITRDTVRNVARVLGINHEDIPSALRWTEAAEVATNANTIVHQIQQQVDNLVAKQRDQAREFGIKEGMLIALARRYAEGSPGHFEAALAGLERALEVARDEHERGRLPSNISTAVDAVIAHIDALNDQGDLEAGQAALDAEINALNEEDERRRAALIRLYEKGVSQAVLIRSVESACRFVVALFDLHRPIDPNEQYLAFRAVLVEWHERGASKGLNFDLDVAIALARTGVSRSTSADQRTGMQIRLGDALCDLGDRESVTVRLEEAITVYKATLQQISHDQAPLDWVKAKIGLGVALWRLGERESGVVRLKKSVAAFRDMLRRVRQDSLPFEWAAAQNGLGNALSTIGWRDKSERGTVYLEKSIIAYRSALRERRQKQVPLDWAATQNNLATALWALGDRKGETTQLHEALQSLYAALEEYPRHRVPLDWAMVQNNIGITLRSLGNLEGGTERLEKAVTAFGAALEERTQDRVLLDWAQSVGNVGEAVRLIAERKSNLALAEQALNQVETAQQTFEAAGHAPYSIYYANQAELVRGLVRKLKGKL